MLFHTWIFLLFFAGFYPVFWVLKDTRFKTPWLLTASYLFYGWWNPLYLLLIAYATLVDYLLVARMEKGRGKRVWLTLSIVNNLGLLGFFKYGCFVAGNINQALSALGLAYALPEPGVLLPVGISFYVFQSMSYTIDFYRGDVKREHSLIRYATFVSLFPQLVAGPIERARNLLPQLRRTDPISARDIGEGLSLFIVGLFKKVALADALGLYVDPIYNLPGQHQSPALMLATFAFGWQIYFDFSGYTDMARGIARMMGIRLMLNFNNPYLATGLGDFWSRWHISLSTWFRDYLYIPLGGNHRGQLMTYRNLFLTMVISGLWHGAAWTFVIWGALHALGMMLTRQLERSLVYRRQVPKLVKQLLVFVYVTFAWIFFRAAGWDDASLIVTRVFSSGFANPYFPLVLLGLVLAVWFYQFLYESGARALLDWAPVKIALVVFMVMYLALFTASGDQPFIYFQF